MLQIEPMQSSGSLLAVPGRVRLEHRLDAVVDAVQRHGLEQHALLRRVGARVVHLGELGVLLVRLLVVALDREVARVGLAGREPLDRIRVLRLPEQQRPRLGVDREQVEERRGARARQAGQHHRPADLALADLRVTAQRSFDPQARGEQLEQAAAVALAAALVEGSPLIGLGEHGERLAEVARAEVREACRGARLGEQRLDVEVGFSGGHALHST
jgi:hypothetical protein